MIRLNIHEAKTHLSRYLNRVARGESILLCKRNKPIAEIRPLRTPRTTRRPIGPKGRVKVPESFFKPLPPELIARFSGRR